MRILVCVKRVPAPGSKINVTDDGLAVDATHLAFVTSPHEECALEEAVQIVERDGGDVHVITLGPPDADDQLRKAAAVGATKLTLVPTDGSAFDPQRTAAALTSAIRDIEAADGQFDLLLFGNESADSGGFQVGIRVARALGRPIVSGAKDIDVVAGAIDVRREVDGGYEVYHLPLPAAVGIKEGINLPRYPTMKGRLASRKAAVETLAADAPVGGQTRVELHRPVEQAKATVILGHGPDAAAAVVDLLEEIGVIP
jgi:electron transfer flavoprotein beta subunit